MKNKIKKHPYLAGYALFLLVSILLASFSFARDRIGRAMGSVVEQSCAVEDFELFDLEPLGDGGYVSVHQDPRLVLAGYEGVLHRVDVVVSLSRNPGEFNLFYKLEPNMPEFSAHQRTWARQVAPGHYVLDGPGKTVYGLRIDPGIFSGNVMYFESIVINPKLPLYSFFMPTVPWLLYLCVLPPLVVALIAYLLQVTRHLQALFHARTKRAEEQAGG
ncbi:hypothetical protein LJB77_00380 [Ruminococcaceae bacterium OttesenSCG-928-N02]|nr:hypothetical protein [Ruminococcaceae bacterium OttesenSCG-928-N02]